MVLPEEHKELFDGKKVGFTEKVGIPWGVDGASRWGEGWFPKEGSFPCGNIATRDDDVPMDWMQHFDERRTKGSLGSIGVAFLVRGGGWGPRSGLFLLVKFGNCGEWEFSTRGVG
jgi:hypothetical protein